MITNKLIIDGMTCDACVEKISEKLQSIPQVQSVEIDRMQKTASVHSLNGISLDQAKSSLKDLPKYKVSEAGASDLKTPPSAADIEIVESKFATYKPLILIFTYIFLVSFSYQVYLGSFNLHSFMNHIMGGFFIGLSFFKFLNLNSFAESFSSYDPFAQKIPGYGKVYPFIELILGLLFVAEIELLAANIITVVVLSITTFGVIKRLQTKSKFKCACLGAGFNLPLSYVTVFENVVMILMAFSGIIKFSN